MPTLDFTPLPFGAAQLPEPAVKDCTKCGQTLPLESFSPAKKGHLGRTSQCKPCADHNLSKGAKDPYAYALELYPWLADTTR
ncbi:hypothetical protein [Streptomyces lydicus]|uniref:hypothetical protein n=1 Tax=Streptomyces lydicus TaxID=47763 RepID=UPI0037A1947D